MQIHEALTLLTDAASNTLPAAPARQMARGLLAHRLRWTEAHLLSEMHTTLPAKLVRELPRLLKRVRDQEPLASLLGSAPFLQHQFLVTRSTLIPRPETEELVHHVLRAWNPSDKGVLAVDIGTGSGCIAVSLAAARTPSAVLATDVSKRALKVARINAQRILGAEAPALTFLHTSLFSRSLQALIRERGPKQLFVVANLPYLPEEDRGRLDRSVTAFEPARALYAKDHGNALILRCLHQLKRFLTQHPSLLCTAWFEHDTPQTHTLKQVAQELFPRASIRILDDENGRSRFLEIVQPAPLDI